MRCCKFTVRCYDRFYVNDVDNEVIARNIILLEIISSINPDNLSDVEYLWDVWYNMTLTQSHYTRLKVTLERLVDGSGSSLWVFGDRETKKRVTMTWKSWIETEPPDVETVKKSRQDLLEFYCRLRSGTSLSNIFVFPSQPFYKNTSMEMRRSGNEVFAGDLTKHMFEWNQVHSAGVARDVVNRSTDEFTNSTMMRPGSSKWHVHYGANPIAAYLPFERYRTYNKILLVFTC